jgi:hypothetical protein
MPLEEAIQRFQEASKALDREEQTCAAAGRQDIVQTTQRAREALNRIIAKTKADVERATSQSAAAPLTTTTTVVSSAQRLAALGAIVAKPTSVTPANVSPYAPEHSVVYTYAGPPLDGVKLTVYDGVKTRWDLVVDAPGLTPDDLSPGGGTFMCENATPVETTRHYRLKKGPLAGAYAVTWASDPGVVQVFSYEAIREQLATERAQGLVNVRSVDDFERLGCPH